MIYLVLTVGFWMFLYSYANSYNRLTDEKIVPAEFTVDENGADLHIAGKKFHFNSDIISSDSKKYFISYILAPVEIRCEIMLLCTESFWENEVGT